VVSDPLEGLRDKDQFDGPRDGPRIFKHVRQEFSENLLIKIVEHVILQDDFLGQLRIRIDECIQTLFENLLGRVRHDRQIDQPFEFRFLDQFRRSLADINRNIADALDVFDNFHGRRNKAQVACDRLFELYANERKWDAKRLPSEAFHAQCVISFESDETQTMRQWDTFEDIGIWASDCYHHDGADSWSAIRARGPAEFRARLEELGPDVVFANEPEWELVGGAYSLAETSVLKRGSRGVVVHEPDGREEHAALGGDVLDTTGAGDALAAGFIVGGIELGLEAAARCVAQLGAVPA